MNKVSYDERTLAYKTALHIYGKSNQLVVALEELSEVQKEICKAMRGKADLDHLAEEIADATIMLEQVRQIYGLNNLVCQKMDEKIKRLVNRMMGGHA